MSAVQSIVRHGAVAFPPDLQSVANFIWTGDLSRLSEPQKLAYLKHMCELHGLDLATQPCAIINFKGVQTFYWKKEAAIQLANIRQVSVRIESKRVNEHGLVEVHAIASDPSGRETHDYGFADPNEKDRNGKTDPVKAHMVAVTRAKRRAILSHCGLSQEAPEDIDDGSNSAPASRAQSAGVDRVNALAAPARQAQPTAQVPGQAVFDSVRKDPSKENIERLTGQEAMEVPPSAPPSATVQTAVDMLEQSKLQPTQVEVIDQETGEIVDARTTEHAEPFDYEKHKWIVNDLFAVMGIPPRWRNNNKTDLRKHLEFRCPAGTHEAIRAEMEAFAKDRPWK